MSDEEIRTAAGQGWALASRDEPSRVVDYFERVLDRHPSEPLALFHCARAHDYAGQPDVAAPLYERAFGTGLSGDELRRGKASYGSTLRNLGRTEEAVAVLAEARHQFPDDAVIPCYLALALNSAGRSTSALAVALDLVLDRVDDPELQANNWALGNYVAALRRGYWRPDRTIP